jgi:endoribonuclease Dicer
MFINLISAQIFLNILTHSLWSIDKVSLMVFDECHHARKNHPYSGIMREYFQLNPPQRPKVFGMTASPIWNPKDAAGSLAALEANMDAKVVGVRAHVDELAQHSPKPIEVSDHSCLFPIGFKFCFRSSSIISILQTNIVILLLHFGNVFACSRMLFGQNWKYPGRI